MMKIQFTPTIPTNDAFSKIDFGPAFHRLMLYFYQGRKNYQFAIMSDQFGKDCSNSKRNFNFYSCSMDA